MKASKRKATKKTIGGVKVVTNPKFTKDEMAPIPQRAFDLLETSFAKQHEALRLVMSAGIAIGRARATASGKRKRK